MIHKEKKNGNDRCGLQDYKISAAGRTFTPDP